MASEAPRELSDAARLVQDILQGIDGSNYTTSALVERVAGYRGRPIVLQPWPMADILIYGAWLAGPKRDFIFYDMNTARVHQDHIVAHELAHMLLGHETVQVDENSEIDINLLMRELYTLHQAPRELEAEALADTIQRELIKRLGLPALTSPVATAPVWPDLMFGLGLDR